jgi:NADH-quinone oxidoreductase subunit C
MSIEVLQGLQSRFPDAVRSVFTIAGDDVAIVDPLRILDLCRALRECGFDQLSDLTAIDTLGLDPKTAARIGGTTGAVASQTPSQLLGGDVGSPVIPAPASGRFQVVYQLRASKTGRRVRLKAPIDEHESESGEIENPVIDSVASIWKAANWAEREVWDMFGIRFRGHPDLRRILMYEEFVGHPLRKDYPKEKRQPLVRRDFS